MLFHHKLRNVLLICGFGFICLSCATTEQSDFSSAAADTETTAENAKASPEQLGMAYLTGKGVPENHQQAIYWLEKAAENGSSSAANSLGYLYFSGNGVAQNYPLAMQWYQQAADAGNPSAKYNLGLMYAYGLGTPVDKIKANEYFNQAASLGFAPTQKRPTV